MTDLSVLLKKLIRANIGKACPDKDSELYVNGKGVDATETQTMMAALTATHEYEISEVRIDEGDNTFDFSLTIPSAQMSWVDAHIPNASELLFAAMKISDDDRLERINKLVKSRSIISGATCTVIRHNGQLYVGSSSKVDQGPYPKSYRTDEKGVRKLIEDDAKEDDILRFIDLRADFSGGGANFSEEVLKLWLDAIASDRFSMLESFEISERAVYSSDPSVPKGDPAIAKICAALEARRLEWLEKRA